MDEDEHSAPSRRKGTLTLLLWGPLTELQSKLRQLPEHTCKVASAPRAVGPFVEVTLVATAGQAELALPPVLEDYVLAQSPCHLPSLAELVQAELKARCQTLSVAESCTGGRVAQQITALAGASEVFVGSAVVYTPVAKHRLLACPQDLLSEHRVVSPATAHAMARGVRDVLDAHWNVAVTGWAGGVMPCSQGQYATPDSSSSAGPAAEKAGYVCFGLSSASLPLDLCAPRSLERCCTQPLRHSVAVEHRFCRSLSRQAIQDQAATLTLALVWLALKGHPLLSRWTRGDLAE